MTAEQFCYWLQGFGELNGAPPTAKQWTSINEHLALVFKKVTPPVQRSELQRLADAQDQASRRQTYVDPFGSGRMARTSDLIATC